MGVTYRSEGGVAVITLNRPEVFNSIDQRITEGVVRGIEQAGTEARAVVITGAGKAFCAGADLGDLSDEYAQAGPDLETTIATRFNPLVRGILDSPVPVIAAINGAAAGAGMGLALACDLRVMDPNAFMMSAFINVALIPDSGTAWFLPQMVGVSRAMEIAMSGRKVPAAEALSLGLVHRLSEAPVEEAVAWAGALADGPTGAYVATRHLIHQAVAASLADTLDAEAVLQGSLGRRPDHLEGMSAFLEKRKPRFGA
ncbi:MAG: enoyl-CoA hydratase-related protein [Acidimicrobiia bacterium]|nr:enoyl-CoA hydratase-related protein [Acidimicrobiia bacterium]